MWPQGIWSTLIRNETGLVADRLLNAQNKMKPNFKKSKCLHLLGLKMSRKWQCFSPEDFFIEQHLFWKKWYSFSFIYGHPRHSNFAPNLAISTHWLLCFNCCWFDRFFFFFIHFYFRLSLLGRSNQYPACLMHRLSLICELSIFDRAYLQGMFSFINHKNFAFINFEVKYFIKKGSLKRLAPSKLFLVSK